jgi:hypothetical protein
MYIIKIFIVIAAFMHISSSLSKYLTNVEMCILHHKNNTKIINSSIILSDKNILIGVYDGYNKEIIECSDDFKYKGYFIINDDFIFRNLLTKVSYYTHSCYFINVKNKSCLFIYTDTNQIINLSIYDENKYNIAYYKNENKDISQCKQKAIFNESFYMCDDNIFDPKILQVHAVSRDNILLTLLVIIFCIFILLVSCYVYCSNVNNTYQDTSYNANDKILFDAKNDILINTCHLYEEVVYSNPKSYKFSGRYSI